jgi:hypothetical protein
VIVDDTRYAQMQPVEVSIKSSGYANPSMLGLILLGIVLLPISIRLIAPFVLRLFRRVTRRIKFPKLWTYSKR